VVREKRAGAYSPEPDGVFRYEFTIFLSAFLLFSLQPLVGRIVLPLFGGAAAVWSACLLYFQCGLLAGYIYGHVMASRVRLGTLRDVHLFLLAAAVLWLVLTARAWEAPLILPSSLRPGHGGPPVAQIVGLLVLSTGLPYFLLSATTPLVQHWFSRSHPERSPYRLYALSNAGSLLALLSYPFLIEPWLTLRQQAWIWAAGFLVFAGLCAACALRMKTKPEPAGAAPVAAPGWRRVLVWLALSACASVMLFATTSEISASIPPMPFVWIAPLTLYLASLILCFHSDRWYRRSWFHLALPPTVACAAIVLAAGSNLPLVAWLTMLLGTLFVCAMICHGELAHLRPPAGQLTAFYLAVAAGGCIGGALAVLAAPRLFRGCWEFHLSLILTAALALGLAIADRHSWLHRTRAWPSAALAFPLGLVLLAARNEDFRDFPWDTLCGTAGSWAGLALAGGVAVLLLVTRAFKNTARVNVWIAGMLIVVAGALLGVDAQNSTQHARLVTRNFFGSLQVEDVGEGADEAALQLIMHATVQGRQYRNILPRRQPTLYLRPNSGIGRAFAVARRLADQRGCGLHIGLIGLGVGTMAAYARAGDDLRVYEINPAVAQLSTGPHPLFTFLADSPAKSEIVEGDGRIALESEAPRNFDLLAVDAFAGFSIPVHLITREAIAVYLKHLNRERGILIFNANNAYLDLGPQMRAQAACAGLAYAYISTEELDGDDAWGANWALMSPNAAILEESEIRTASQIVGAAIPKCWTDDFSAIYRCLR
jgi:hypothetical protein